MISGDSAGLAPWLRWSGVVLGGMLALACAPSEPHENVLQVQSELNAEQRRARSAQIRDAAAGVGLDNSLLLGGIASAETGMAQCWSEATWACQGPNSPDCGGGPVIAGSADGPCSSQQGGLGIFQFDAGTYAQTLAREGDRILTVAGNVQAGIDFVASMVTRSVYIDNVATRDEAIAWMNGVRAYNQLWQPWIQTVTHYYNGCVPGSCSIYTTRFNNYSDRTSELIPQLGADFWYGRAPGCGPIPAQGGVLDETDYCFGAGGDPTTWRHVTGAGNDAELLWTYATDSADFDSWAFWELQLAEAGIYKLEAYTDSAYAGSKQVKYEVTHAAKLDEIVVDQTARSGWTELGSFDFSAGGEQRLKLGDNSGEPLENEVRIVADAIRLTRVTDAQTPDPVVPNPTEPNPTQPMPTNPGQPIVPTQPNPSPGSGQPPMPAAEPQATAAQADAGCACTSAPSGSGAGALVSLMLALGLGRARRRKAAASPRPGLGCAPGELGFWTRAPRADCLRAAARGQRAR